MVKLPAAPLANPQARQGEPVKVVWVRAPSGALLPMHEADLVLMSYEELRDELGAALK